MFYRSGNLTPTTNLTRLFICNFSEPEASYTRIEEVIWFYRDIGRPFQTPHRPNSESWTFASFPINPVTWFTYLVLLRDVVEYLRNANFDENPVIYLHACVRCPFSVSHHAMFRFHMYDLFWFNTPSEMYARIRSLRFRFFFLSTTNLPRQEIFVEHLRFTTTYSGPFYYDLSCEQ